MSVDFHSIMSGRRRGVWATCLRGGLWLASLAYGAVVTIRNRRYDRGRSEIHDCGVPVISVGNLTTGGTGKTPIVCLLAKWFRKRDIRVAIVSRGYGRGSEDSNDEAKELHARLPDVPHVQDADRVAAARVAVDELQSQVVLMDDGFQHRRLGRDLDVVVVDATCPFGYEYLLPRGLLREPIQGIRRAQLAIITRCASAGDKAVDRIEERIVRLNDSIAVLRSDHRPTAILQYPDHSEPIEKLDGDSVAVISAIGNPEAFEQTVRQCGADIVATRRLPDHDPYGPETVAALREWIESLGETISRVVCTHKDLVKLRTDRLAGKPLGAILIDLELAGDQSALEERLSRIASLTPPD